VTLNFTSISQTVSLDTAAAGIAGNTVSTLLTDAPSLKKTSSLHKITLPPYASWIGSVK
jgi:alpha-glucosidase